MFFLKPGLLLALALIMSGATGCGKRITRVEAGNRDQVLHWGNGAEPEDLDPHTSKGEPEHNIQLALFEGLVAEEPRNAAPTNGVAERWEVSPDGKIWTFYLRKTARWSNGDPVQASDFVESWKRNLTPALASQYAYMLHVVKKAKEYNEGTLTNWSEVGFKVIDPQTVQIELTSPTPYFLSLILHTSWYPVHIPTLLKYGRLDDRRNPWTRPENIVGNGAFVLKEWRMASHIIVEKSPTYWDAKNVKLNQIYFYAAESQESEEKMFRSGQIHLLKECPQAKIEFYKKNNPHLINIAPILTTYFYRINTTRPPLNDPRVRKALAMAIDRKSIVENVTRGSQVPAYNLTPPDTGGFTGNAGLKEDLNEARNLLSQAGYPNGQNFPKVEILFNTLESHRAIAEALQEMWRKNLNIQVQLRNEEWKVYLSSMQQLDYYICRAGWGGDYDDPNTFLDMFVTGGGNNETGWSNKRYDQLIEEAGKIADQKKRFEIFQEAENLLMSEMPIIPVYFYTRPRLIQPALKEFYPNLLDHHPYKYMYLEPAKTAALQP
jgi:oligopeptide transport system substrate-binding protein